jgi:hypothetical protein
MNTELQLVALYGVAIPLSEVCETHLGLSYTEASRKAATEDLPVPTFRMRDSNKSPLLISAKHLAAYLDQKTAIAEEVWKKCQA